MNAEHWKTIKASLKEKTQGRAWYWEPTKDVM